MPITNRGTMSKAIRLTQPTKEPAYVSRNEGLPLRPGQKPADRFVYVHYPTRWEYNAEHGFLPTLSKIPARPGVNGVDKHGNLTGPLVVIQQQGGTYIDPTDPRLQDFQDYVQYYTCENGAKWWVDSCMEAVVLPGRKIVWKSKPGAWDAFRAHLRDSEIIQPVLPEVFDLMVEKQQSRIERKAARSGLSPVYKAQYDAEVGILEAMQSAWEKSHKDELEAMQAQIKAGKRKIKRGKQTASNIVTGA